MRELCKKYLVENYKAIEDEFPETIDLITDVNVMREMFKASRQK